MGIEEELEKQIIRNAKKQADKIIKDARLSADATYASSLEYVDDMLSELNLITLRAKESMRNLMEEMLNEFDRELDVLQQNKVEILEDLRNMSENGKERLKRANYDIKVNEAYFLKKPYEIKSAENGKESTEVRKAAKQSFEIKVADEWRERIEQLSKEREMAEEEADGISFKNTAEPEKYYSNRAEIKVTETEEEEQQNTETEDGYSAADFDLDAEYFNWLDEKPKENQNKTKIGIWKTRKRRK